MWQQSGNRRPSNVFGLQAQMARWKKLWTLWMLWTVTVIATQLGAALLPLVQSPLSKALLSAQLGSSLRPPAVSHLTGWFPMLSTFLTGNRLELNSGPNAMGMLWRRHLSTGNHSGVVAAVCYACGYAQCLARVLGRAEVQNKYQY